VRAADNLATIKSFPDHYAKSGVRRAHSSVCRFFLYFTRVAFYAIFCTAARRQMRAGLHCTRAVSCMCAIADVIRRQNKFAKVHPRPPPPTAERAHVTHILLRRRAGSIRECHPPAAAATTTDTDAAADPCAIRPPTYLHVYALASHACIEWICRRACMQPAPLVCS